eukprot:jgi/Bigna1/142002/aug1.66_g16710
MPDESLQDVPKNRKHFHETIISVKRTSISMLRQAFCQGALIPRKVQSYPYGGRMNAVARYYLLIINAVSAFVFVADKFNSKLGWRRIPEKTLLLCSLLGGAPAGLATMYIFRHKTAKTSFKIPMCLATTACFAWLAFVIF